MKQSGVARLVMRLVIIQYNCGLIQFHLIHSVFNYQYLHNIITILFYISSLSYNVKTESYFQHVTNYQLTDYVQDPTMYTDQLNVVN